MSRELKFRAWDGEELICPNTRMFGGVSNGDILRDWPSTIMQFTGLKDKNGKEIYEGDIITNGLVTERVIFSKQAFRLKTTEPEKFSDEILYFVPTTSFEIIGNIYQTPNLLED